MAKENTKMIPYDVIVDFMGYISKCKHDGMSNEEIADNCPYPEYYTRDSILELINTVMCGVYIAKGTALVHNTGKLNDALSNIIKAVHRIKDEVSTGVVLENSLDGILENTAEIISMINTGQTREERNKI